MSSLEKVIRSADAGSAIAFRERAYGEIERHGFLREILGLANALVDGPRYLIMGVRDSGPDGRIFVGISAAELGEAHEFYQTQIGRFIEPSLNIDLKSLEIDGASVAILTLNDCAQPPYLLREDVSNTMRAGSGWIRRSTESSRLRRADLQKLFKKAAVSPVLQPTIQVNFAGEVPLEEITLAVLDLSELPSGVAGGKFRKLLEAREASRDIGGRTTTRIDRLVYAREFGSTQPYQRISEDSLVRRLDATEEDYRVADDYYEYEIRTHQVNISLANIGGADLLDAFLTLDFPHVDGLGISEYIRLAPDSEKERPAGYPTVETGERKIRVQSTIESVPRGATVQAFSQPLRIWVREPVAGLTLAVDYALRATSLSEPVIGTLRLHVGDS
ncbi:MAG: ATP-binding protein [Gammaproteobacteria bacterium]|nr:ATP-binding protein [Gammaproteobacteria bacterium]